MPNSLNKLILIIIAIGAFIGAFIVGRYLGLVYFFFLLVGYIGYWLAGWYSKKEKQNHRFKNVICWSNVITWLIPVLGLGTAVATYRFGQIENNKKYRNLGAIGLFLSIINGIVGAYLEIY